MGVKLHAGAVFDLRFWWEDPPPGEAVRFDDRAAARRFVARLSTEPGLLVILRRFARDGAPGVWAAPDDDDMIDRLAGALAAGRVRVGRSRHEALSSWGDREEEAPISAPVPVAAPVPPAEEICWPCLRAAASARALREASAAGSPFVVQDQP